MFGSNIFLAKVRDHQKYMNRDVPNFEFGSKFEKSSRFFGFGSSFAGSNLPRTEPFENFIFFQILNIFFLFFFLLFSINSLIFYLIIKTNFGECKIYIIFTFGSLKPLETGL